MGVLLSNAAIIAPVVYRNSRRGLLDENDERRHNPQRMNTGGGTIRSGTNDGCKHQGPPDFSDRAVSVLAAITVAPVAAGFVWSCGLRQPRGAR